MTPIIIIDTSPALLGRLAKFDRSRSSPIGETMILVKKIPFNDRLVA
jgi:hypothetical protein